VNPKRNPLPSELNRKTRNAWWMWISGLAALFFAGSELVALWMGGSGQLWAILPVFIAAPIAFWLVRTGRHIHGSILFMSAIGLQAILTPLVQRGLGVPNSITSVALISGISLATLPRRFTGRVLMGALSISIASTLIDLFGSSSRPAAELIEGRWIFAFVMLVIFLIFFAREFFSLDIRTKIVLGILGTGSLALAVLAFFALNQTKEITSTLAERLDASVSQLAEEQLANTAFTEANLANQTFEDVMEEVAGLAQNWVSLKSRKDVLSQGPYWDSRTRLMQLNAGHYGNSPADPSSVFVPVNLQIDESLIADLNVSAYLDFYAGGVLKTHPSLLAVYAIDTRGVIRYYPNINLASILPPDFDATKRPYFEILSPLLNPQHRSRWTIPYVDAAGGGLVVTVAAPVYEGDKFSGVVAADMKLVNVTEQVSAIKIGRTGYAFMIDDTGRILSMPSAGYEMFGVRPEDLNSEDFFKQTILGSGSDHLQTVTRRMVAGRDGLLVVDANGIDTYISFSPVKANGYSIALVVPVSELQEASITARNETQLQILSASRVAAIILIILLIIAVAVSLGLGQVISAPIQRLTQVASQVARGDLTVQASATTSDEIGTLADSFNTMTSRLRETLDELEHKVEERTAELLAANKRNERRAKQFESIAQVARTISSTRDLESLLRQITTVISNQFGFYHVGIFLLDPRREYAVLSAANSKGGQRMLARNHQLRVGETGIVGVVTGTGKPRVALNTGEDSLFFNNPDLPETRSEISLPLLVGDDVIGALDVQSTKPNAFDSEDINILTTLADQVSIAIQNARQYEETRKALVESDLLSRQFIQTGWQQFTKTKKLVGIRHTGARATLIYRKNGRNKSENDLNWDQAKTEFNSASLSLPVKLRGEVIGSVDVRAPGNRKWEQDELEIVTAIIERAALALENARLLAESQKRAAKERTIGEISSKISMQSDINELLKTAAQALGNILPGAEIEIQFNKEDE
jgi:GAF domain-containing protein/HAMP domain-containing protein